MKAIEIEGPGGPEVLRLVTRPDPEPGPREVLIKVAAAGINRPDILQRMGLYPPPPGASDIPGLEVSGTILACGAEVEEWRPGDRVVALLAGGGYAELAVAPAETLLPVPDTLPLADAAGLPETLFTVWSNVFERGCLDAGEWLLCHGGSSGIGTMAIQLAKAFDAQVIVTAGTDAKCAFCRELGADQAVNYRTADFVAAVEEATGGRGVDVVLDMVGGDYVPRNIRCLAEAGRHVSIAFLRGPRAEIDIVAIMRKRLTLTGSTLRNRALAFKAALRDEIRHLVWPLVAEGRVRPVIDSRFRLEDVAAAHRRLEAGEHMGKILLMVGD